MSTQASTTQPASLATSPLTGGPTRTIWHMGARMDFKATGDTTDGRFWLAEQTSPRGYASPLHRHTREDELFVVLDGELSVRVDGIIERVPAGSAAFAPRGLPHGFAVESPSARFFIVSTPAGFERWFFETGTPATSSSPPPVTGPPDVERLLASLEAYGVEFLGSAV